MSTSTAIAGSNKDAVLSENFYCDSAGGLPTARSSDVRSSSIAPAFTTKVANLLPRAACCIETFTDGRENVTCDRACAIGALTSKPMAPRISSGRPPMGAGVTG